MDTPVRKHLRPEWIRGLLDTEAYPHAVGEIQLIETHISWVFLTGEYAYKIKKPVNLGFLDFSTLEARKFFCEEELRLNSRTSGEFYLGVVPIGMSDGRPVIGGQPAVEYAVRMRQFAPDARLDRQLAAGQVSAADLQRLASLLADFYLQAPVAKGHDPAMAAERASAPALANFEHIQGDHISRESRLRIDTVETWTRAQAVALEPVFQQRAAQGFVRECHGDLHLANLFAWQGRIYPYDCLEFNPDLRWIDQASDIAFLVMDLMARGRTDLAFIFLNTWLEETGDYGSLAVLRFYLVYRSMVRLKVAAIQTRLLHEDAQGEHAIKARLYLDLARHLMDRPAHPRLVIMHGLSASGKTHTSNGLVPGMPAIRLRSDLERKRLYGLSRYHHHASGIDTGPYSEAGTEATYRKLLAECETGLKAGFNMVVDATFGRRRWRSRFMAKARETGAEPRIMTCSAPLETLKQRIRERMAEGVDESDANLEVLERQLANFEPLDEHERLVASADLQLPET